MAQLTSHPSTTFFGTAATCPRAHLLQWSMLCLSHSLEHTSQMSAHTLQNCFANRLSIDINDADVQTGEKSEIKCDAIFIAIGHKPNTQAFEGQVELYDRGYVRRYNESKTSVEGVFLLPVMFTIMCTNKQ
jgi:hypothetical protein